ncbi:GNAT family N-acetyltransferase [Pelagicoccus sp. SDUM812002]|uniref:GNAT family N-acetyltransferase n=1 Tax=Pelagicoccus sp. SDUM812002 TaxID=3041266 RepID=UPI00280FF9F3|nr:GNAT family N-acetyltransferase [Pelagicoccus sp. SDUM812002]MDQ8188067.1 GNAT family N-acetyltransferase [Pelagicoccus sp. SDUM812002]
MTLNEPSSQSSTPAVCEAITQSGNQKAWIAAICSLDESSRFLCSDWTQILHKAYGFEPELVILLAGERVEAVLPFVEVNSILTGKRAVSLPFIDICRPSARDSNHIPLLHAALRAEGKKRGWNYLELRGEIPENESPQSSLSFFNHIVDLRPCPDNIFADLAPSNRRAIRKAQKEGIRIEFSHSLGSLRGFYRLQCITRKRHGLPSQPFKFFKCLHKVLIETRRGVIVSAFTNDNRLAASAIYLEQGSTVHYKYGASDKNFQNSRCNNLVMWSAMEHYSKRGFHQMDLGRNSTTNAGLRRYKLSWGSSEQEVHYQRYDLKKNATVPMSDDVFGWHNSVFKRLPIPILRLAGRLLYRHIA